LAACEASVCSLVRFFVRISKNKKTRNLAPQLSPLDRLTPRHHQILHGLATGLARKQAASALKISARTYDVHLFTARLRIGALTTAHAAARYAALRTAAGFRIYLMAGSP
jgi:FixJ family two-component response regulator